jgi:DNA polymerase I
MSSEAHARLPPAGDPNTLYVVDISGYLFRAYHALPPLQNAHGEATHAVLGVTTMLLKLAQERRPSMLVMAMDSPGPSFRHERFDQYKAHRPAMPPDLAPQVVRLQQIVDAYRFAVFRQSGVEADDVIATLVKWARARGLSVVIVSSDKDLMQLVGDGVWMLDTMRDAVFGPDEVLAKLGVKPSQVRDYLALVGDSTDNVPGVPSVGPKTAVQLLTEHGDLDRLYAAVERVERKALRQKLIDHRADAFLSRDLASLKDDLDLNPDLAALRVPVPDLERLRQLFTELSFTRLLTQLTDDAAQKAQGVLRGMGASDDELAAPSAQPPPAPAEPPPAEIILDAGALTALVARLEQAPNAALLSLSEGLHPVSGQLIGIAFAIGSEAAYLPLGHCYLGCPEQLATAQVLAELGDFLRSARKSKVSCDIKREQMVLAEHGIELSGAAFDTMLASYLVDPEVHSHRLVDVARFELDKPLADLDKPLLERRALAGKLSGQPIESAGPRAAQLARLILEAQAALQPKLERVGSVHLLQDLELPLARTLAEVERTGFRVDVQYLGRLSQSVDSQLIELEQRCRQLAGRDFNVGSPRQLEMILFDELSLPVVKRTKTARSTDHSVLEELAVMHALPAAILEHRILAKLKSTYLDALPKEVNPKTGRIHTDFRQAVAATGRLSSSDPNLQNIPIRTELGRSIRDAFVPREGWQILSADYSQIELRVLAHLSSDRELLEAFHDDADVHSRTARAIFGVDKAAVTREMRGQAKTVNYAVIYGQTQFALARNLRIERSEAARYIKAFFEKYSGVAAYMQNVVAEATLSGEVRTLLGRVRKLPDLTSRDRMKRQAAERVARNTPIQGSAADIIKLAMVAVHRELVARKLQSKMLLTVHDELVFEAPPDEQAELELLVRECMEHVVELAVPLVVDRGWGATWGQAH